MRPAPTGAAPDEASLEIDPLWTARILTDFLATELGRTGRKKLVVGLSGGLDSSVAAVLAARAIGPEQVLGLLLPYRTSHPGSLRDAERLARKLGIASETIDISTMVDDLEREARVRGRIRLGNVMARIRMILLYDRSEKHDGLVLGTTNKTELLLGYGTLHGDMASALNPLGDLYKTQVRALAVHLKVPTAILDKPPSADLWADQTDEDELGFSYDRIDRLLALIIDARISRKRAAAAGFPGSMVDRVWRLIVRSQFKRRPAVIAKMSTRSVGWDFRYPRDWLT